MKFSDYGAEENNEIIVRGFVRDELTFDHVYVRDFYKEKFYKTVLVAKRQSQVPDYVPLFISERLLKAKGEFTNWKEKRLEVFGQVRTYNLTGEDGKRHLIVGVYVLDFAFENSAFWTQNDFNMSHLIGSICQKGQVRATPFGKTLIDFMVVIKRRNGKFFFVPCIAWADKAEYLSRFNLGEKIELWGRFQSRIYIKREYPTDVGERKITYEVSVSEIIPI